MHYEWSGGGNGGFAEADGPSAMAPFDWGDLVTVQSSEVIETRFPLLVEESRLAADTGGAGSLARRARHAAAHAATGAEARYSLLSDGAMVPAFGVLGGMSGLPVASWVEGRGGGAIHDFDTPGKVGGHVLHEGDRVVLRSAGGGGYGDPLQRPAERVADDVGPGSSRFGRRSGSTAWCSRGMASVDEAATGAAQGRDPRRARAARGGGCGRLLSGGAGQPAAHLPAQSGDASRAGIGEGDLVELDTRRAAPLRAWAEIDAAIAPGTLPIDARGLDIQRAKQGEAIEVRLLRRAGSGPRDEQGPG